MVKLTEKIGEEPIVYVGRHFLYDIIERMSEYPRIGPLLHIYDTISEYPTVNIQLPYNIGLIEVLEELVDIFIRPPITEYITEFPSIFVKAPYNFDLIESIMELPFSDVEPTSGIIPTETITELVKVTNIPAPNKWAIDVYESIFEYSEKSIISQTWSILNSLNISYLGVGNPYSSVVSGGFLYVGTDASAIVKIYLVTFTVANTLVIGGGLLGYIFGLCVVGSDLYAVLQASNGMVSKIDLNTFTLTSTLTFSDVGFGYAACIAYDSVGGYLYAGFDQSPAKIVKINPYPFAQVGSTLSLNSGENTATGMVANSSILYVCLETISGQVARVNLGSFTESGSALSLLSGEDSCSCIVVMSGTLYIGLFSSNNLITVTEIPFLEGISLALSSGTKIESMLAGGTHIFVGMNDGSLKKVSVSPFTEVGSLSLGSHSVIGLSLDNSTGYLYACYYAFPFGTSLVYQINAYP
jgi:hypothetical protein